VPAAAVIPTPRVSSVDAAVKRSVVGACGRRAATEAATSARGVGAGGVHGIDRREMKWPGPCLDGRGRRRCTGTALGIKDEGWGIEGD